LSNPALLKISDLSVQYQFETRKIDALRGVSFDIPSQGFTLGIVGESGSGKTTLGMAIMNAIERPGRIVDGAIQYEGQDVLRMNSDELRHYRWKEVSMVFQSAMNSLNPVKPVVHPILEVMKEHHIASKLDRKLRAEQLLAEMEIDVKRAKAYPHEFSGGMRQRIEIALALALSPKVLICDEPTSALDVVVQKQILGMIHKEVKERGLSLIFITHEIPLLVGLVDKIAVMHAGKIVELGRINDVLYNPQHPYTEMLIGTLLTMSTPRESVFDYTRESTRKIESVNACRFSDRCKYAFAKCRVEEPLLLETKEGSMVACHKYN
jgi:peptide/nickel transport system ATP-binding protein